MRPRITVTCLLACLLAFLNMRGAPGNIAAQASFSQTATPVASPQKTPPAQQPESIKIYTEEVLLPLIATDSNGRFDPTLEAEDLLILEDGKPQTIRSVRRTPASVLLLLDTGGFRNPAMKTNATRELAVSLVSQLRSGDQVAVLQFGGKVELIQSWIEDQEVTIHSLKSKLSSGRNGRLKDALAAASAQLKIAPPGNRHIVLVTDGGEFPVEEAELAQAMGQLYATQATVHIVSYTLLGRKAVDGQHPKIPVLPTGIKRNSGQTTYGPIRPNAPETLQAELNRKSRLHVILTKSYPMVVDLDYPMWRHSRGQLKTLKENQLALGWLAEESGGSMLLPNSTEDFPKLGAELAREIDAQYLVTYRPKLGMAPKSTEEIRHIEVVSRRVGLRVYSRRSYLVRAAQ